ncbi:hypothetical protein [Candidatus Albibeggiatoa sp. nov. BB20]|uniref:hypothetical protein n=1 Tax=Candidatus Albibeggiatoa sp. nov. BB20 TaxID=3162723 RepID=UPI0033659A62
MPLGEKELLEHDATRDIGTELLGTIRDIKQGHYGETYQIKPNEIAETRMCCKMSQSEFANAFDISS